MVQQAGGQTSVTSTARSIFQPNGLASFVSNSQSSRLSSVIPVEVIHASLPHKRELKVGVGVDATRHDIFMRGINNLCSLWNL